MKVPVPVPLSVMSLMGWEAPKMLSLISRRSRLLDGPGRAGRGRIAGAKAPAHSVLDVAYAALCHGVEVGDLPPRFTRSALLALTAEGAHGLRCRMPSGAESSRADRFPR